MKNNTLHALALLYGFTVVSSAGADDGVHAVRADSAERTVSNGQTQPPVKFATIWADDDGATHIGHCRFEGLKFKSYAPLQRLSGLAFPLTRWRALPMLYSPRAMLATGVMHRVLSGLSPCPVNGLWKPRTAPRWPRGLERCSSMRTAIHGHAAGIKESGTCHERSEASQTCS